MALVDRELVPGALQVERNREAALMPPLRCQGALVLAHHRQYLVTRLLVGHRHQYQVTHLQVGYRHLYLGRMLLCLRRYQARRICLHHFLESVGTRLQE